MSTHDDDDEPGGDGEDGATSDTERRFVDRSARRARTHRSDDDRALVGREHRVVERAATASERRKERRAAQSAAQVPDMIERELGDGRVMEFVAREHTEPWVILDREILTPEEARIVERSRRDSKDPLLVEDGAKMFARLLRKELDDRSEQKRRADEHMAIIDTTPSGKLASRVGALEKRTKFWNRVIWVIAIAIGGGLFEAATRLWDRSAHETALEYELKQAKIDNARQDDENKRQDEEIRHLTHLLERDDHPRSQHSSKDNQP